MRFPQILVIVLICASSAMALAKDFEVKYKVGKDETAWFLSQVFYGTGKDYLKILDANQMKSADELVTGKEIIVKNPLHHPEQATFTERYAKLWEKREKALEAKRGMPLTEVVVASSGVKTESLLPTTEVKDPHKSPMDKAREELQKLSEKESFKRTSSTGSEPF